MSKFLILMATYNGEKYLREQIDSLRQQTLTDWKLLVRDDNSDDSTTEIVKEYQELDPRIILLEDSYGGTGSPHLNFEKLLIASLRYQAEIYMFADQDDVWICKKLERISKSVGIMSKEWATVPTIIYSDLMVVDEKLNELSKSFMSFQGLHHELVNPASTLSVQNFVTGCSSAFNRCLIELSVPFDTAVVMHDWWLALLASFNGKVDYIDAPLVKYRQHSHNQVGAKGKDLWRNPFKPYLYKNVIAAPLSLKYTIMQAIAAAKRSNERGYSNFLIDSVSRLENAGLVDRFKVFFANRLTKQHWTLSIYMYFLLFFVNFKSYRE
ncbi:glycosyltransferase family 2 protein [Lacimicrobium sp. SS2-24]|uniref:glycosyltransferase family 2 protein n=1 Tax=Lacimicrobium sp. SS2-24 TaxID=2005569 RepID=UPI000B4AF3F7|nr:glycosyltransferase family 2 protein [Lacimicrobium sp. SS2-24]